MLRWDIDPAYVLCILLLYILLVQQLNVLGCTAMLQSVSSFGCCSLQSQGHTVAHRDSVTGCCSICPGVPRTGLGGGSGLKCLYLILQSADAGAVSHDGFMITYCIIYMILTTRCALLRKHKL
jgi:hypothetical protein